MRLWQNQTFKFVYGCVWSSMLVKSIRIGILGFIMIHPVFNIKSHIKCENVTQAAEDWPAKGAEGAAKVRQCDSVLDKRITNIC